MRAPRVRNFVRPVTAGAAAAVLASAALLGAAGAARAQTFALPDFAANTYAGGLSAPTAMSFSPDGRLFVTEKGGTVRVITPNGATGTLQSTPFVTLSGVDSAGERGAIGLAFAPDFASSQRVYVHYTSTAGGSHGRVSYFTASGNVASGAETPILNLPNLSGATNHNGGAIHFGPDGNLYVAVGENANPALSQDLSSPLGKILRLTAEGATPADNPFVGTSGADARVWALGLRNPFTFAFQPGTGLMYVNDVGQNTWEEVNVGGAGRNYGWGSGGGANEGPFTPTGGLSGFTPPLFAYGHGSGTSLGNSIAGGAFYNPVTSLFPSQFTGDYFYADFVNGWIRYLDAGTANSNLLVSGFGSNSLVDLQVGPDGALYYLNISNGTVGRIAYTGAAVAVPEPGTAALTALGLAGVLTVVRHRRRRRA
jgi:glucose/arabinose dehydrogenase